MIAARRESVFATIRQVFWLLRATFVLIPLLAGCDKLQMYFTGHPFLAHWEQYLAPVLPNLLGVKPETFMFGTGFIEVGLALLVALWPRWGGYLWSAWMLGIILNIFILSLHFDVALRDFGLAVAAYSLARLAMVYAAAERAEPAGLTEVEPVPHSVRHAA